MDHVSKPRVVVAGAPGRVEVPGLDERRDPRHPGRPLPRDRLAGLDVVRGRAARRRRAACAGRRRGWTRPPRSTTACVVSAQLVRAEQEQRRVGERARVQRASGPDASPTSSRGSRVHWPQKVPPGVRLPATWSRTDVGRADVVVVADAAAVPQQRVRVRARRSPRRRAWRRGRRSRRRRRGRTRPSRAAAAGRGGSASARDPRRRARRPPRPRPTPRSRPPLVLNRRKFAEHARVVVVGRAPRTRARRARPAASGGSGRRAARGSPSRRSGAAPRDTGSRARSPAGRRGSAKPTPACPSGLSLRRQEPAAAREHGRGRAAVGAERPRVRLHPRDVDPAGREPRVEPRAALGPVLAVEDARARASAGRRSPAARARRGCRRRPAPRPRT